MLSAAYPSRKGRARMDVGGNTFGVEATEVFRVDEDIATPRAILDAFDILDQRSIVPGKRGAGAIAPRHQRLADEDLAGSHRIDVPVVDPSARRQYDPP